MAGIGGGSVPANTPKVGDLVASPTAATSLDTLVVDLSSATGTSDPLSKTFVLKNTAVAPVNISLTVAGAPGVQAAFPDNSSHARLRVNHETSVTVTSNPLHAGSLNGGQVVISVSGVAKPLTVPLHGAQAPLPPGAVTATPEANGAVHVTWAASPSTGVAGYQVDRRVSGGPWQPLDASAPAGGIVDQTAPNGQAVDYRVSAITAGVEPTLLSVSSAPGSAVPDATAPDVPNEVTPPDFVNQGNENAVPVKVFLPQTSAPTDVVSVTLTNPTTGDSASATTAGGQSPVSVNIDASQIPDGMLNATSTVTDAVGNPSTVFDGTSVLKDTIAPDAPTDVHAPEVVNGDEAASVPVTVHVADPDSSARLHVQIAAGDQTADSSGDVMGFATTLNVDASKLPDGRLTVSAWTVDEAGNPSAPTDGGTITKDSSPPENSASLRVAGGDQNPDGYVNAASAGAVTVIARFPQATDPADSVVVSVGGQRVRFDGGDYRYVVGPLDLTDVPDGQLPLAVTVTDPAGNSSTTRDTRHQGHGRAGGSHVVHGARERRQRRRVRQLAQPVFRDHPGHVPRRHRLVRHADGERRRRRPRRTGRRLDRRRMARRRERIRRRHARSARHDHRRGGKQHRFLRSRRQGDPAAARRRSPPTSSGPAGPTRSPRRPRRDVSVQVALPDAPGMSGTVTVTLTDSAGHTASGSAWGDRGIVVVHGIDASSFVPGHVQRLCLRDRFGGQHVDVRRHDGGPHRRMSRPPGPGRSLAPMSSALVGR